MNKRHGKLAQQWLNAILALVIVGLAAALTSHFKTEFDWTAGHRNTLTTASRTLLTALPGPIQFYGFVFSDDTTQRQNITHVVDRYRQFKKNVTLTFVDPSRDPQKVKQLGVTQAGQLVVEYDGRHEALDQISEPEISDALERLAHASKTTIAFLTGDGERNIDGTDNNGYSTFAAKLRNKGFKVTKLNLALTPVIPSDTSVLVIADPRNQMLPQQEAVIAKYVTAGGSLLWLADTDAKPGLEAIAKTLGIQWLPGFVIFPNYRELGMGSPGIYLAARYPKNPVTGSLGEITVFPLVRGLTYAKHTDSAWHRFPMLETDAQAWEKVDVKDDSIVFNAKKGDLQGPLTIGLALTRTVNSPTTTAGDAALHASTQTATDKASDPARPTPESSASKAAKKPAAAPKQQRVAVVGDADFLANGTINVLGNSALGIDTITWLANRNTSLTIEIPKAPDHNLYLPGWASWIITAGYVVILPLILILFGVARWAIRRRR